jgi:nicotinamidase-related amidase
LLEFEDDDALLVIDVFDDFDHPDGDKLLETFRRRAPNMHRAIEQARARRIPVVYVNDAHGRWDSDARSLIAQALEGKGGDTIRLLLPKPGEPLLLKHRYSAFDHTPLDLLLEAKGVGRVILAGAATEACIVQTAIDAREWNLKTTIAVDACATANRELEGVALRYAEAVVGARLGRVGD